MKERPRWLPWVIAFAYVALVAVILIIAARLFADAGIEAIGLTLTVGTAAVTWAWRRARRSEPAEDAELGRAQRALALMVRDQWDEEAAARGLVDPAPIPVRWRSAQQESGDYARLVGGALEGDCGDMAGFARAFRALPHRRLVVLGAPGSGKSTLVLLLVRELLARPEPDEPVPVLLSLSTWDPHGEPLIGWIARRLREDYPALRNHDGYNRTAATELVGERRVLPVLDGLDELEAHVRAPALAAVNRALAGGMSVILTSRTAEFNAAVDQEDVVTAAAVVVAEPVSVEQAVDFLADGISPRRAAAWQEVFRAMREHPEGPLATALRLPLNVWLVRTAYGTAHGDPGDLTRFTDPQAVQERLLDTLIPAVYTGGTDRAAEITVQNAPEDAAARWRADDARRWLGFLAAHLRLLGTDQLSWWQLNRALPPDPAGPLSGPVLGAVFGLGAGTAAVGTLVQWASGMAQLNGFLVITAATAIGATAVIRLTSGALARRTSEVAIRNAGAAVGVLALSGLCVALEVDHLVRLISTVGPYAVTPGAGARAAVAWSAAVLVVGAGIALLATWMRRPGASRGGRTGLARLGRLALFALIYLLGTGLGSALMNIPPAETPGTPGLVKDPTLGSDLLFVARSAANGALYFLLVAGTMLSLAPPGEFTAPGYLDFRLSGRVGRLANRLPGMLLRGLVLGGLVGCAVGFFAYAGGIPRHIVVEGTMLFGAVVGAVCGIGGAVVEWARTPADTDHSTPVSTLAGDRRLAAAAMVIAVLPLVVKWLIATAGHFRDGPNAVLNSAAAPAEALEGGLSLGCAVGLMFVSQTAWFAYRETGLRLAADRRLTRTLIAFLEDARLLCILRRTGASYQFRHAALQEHLARPFDPGYTAAGDRLRQSAQPARIGGSGAQPTDSSRRSPPDPL